MAKYKIIAFLTLVCTLAVLCSAIFSLLFVTKPILDANQFDVLGWNLARGNGFTDEMLNPSMSREPAYPYFLSVIYKICGHNYAAVFIVQSLLFACTAVLSFVLANHIFGIKTAGISSLIVAISPTLGNYTIYLLSEIFFAFWLMVFILVLTYALNKGSYLGISLSGIILALLVLTKAIMVFCVFFIIVGFFMFYFKKTRFLKKFFLSAAILFISFIMFLSPWMIRNKQIFKTYSVTALRGGKALYNRSLKLDYDWHRWGKIIVYSMSEFLGDKIYPGSGIEPNKFLLIEDHRAEEKIKQLSKDGLSPSEIDGVLIRSSLEKIRARPFLYIGQSLFESVKLLGFVYIPSLSDNSAPVLFPKLKDHGIRLTVVRGSLRFLAYIIFLFFVGGILLSTRLWRKWLITLLVILYIIVGYSLTFCWARYTVPLIPYYVIFAVFFIRRILLTE